jgi:hypothetical protein
MRLIRRRSLNLCVTLWAAASVATVFPDSPTAGLLDRRAPLSFPDRIEPIELPAPAQSLSEPTLPEMSLPNPSQAGQVNGASTREAFRRRQEYLRRLRAQTPPPAKPAGDGR